MVCPTPQGDHKTYKFFAVRRRAKTEPSILTMTTEEIRGILFAPPNIQINRFVARGAENFEGMYP